MPVEAGDLPQVAEVEHPLDVVDLDLVDPEPLDQPGAQRRIHAGADLESHDLAEAPSPELVLDRLEQVVGLVGDLEVGVAGDPEQVVADDVQPREQGAEVEAMISSSGMNVLAEISTKRGRTSLGTFTRANTSWLEIRVVQADDQAERQVRDVGERPAGADRQRRQHGEDLLAEVALASARAGRSTARSVTIRMPCSASAGRTTSVN